MKTVKKELTASQQSHVDKKMKSFEASTAMLSGSKLLKYCVQAFGVKCLNEDGEEYSPKSKSSIISALREIAFEYYTVEAMELSEMAEAQENSSIQEILKSKAKAINPNDTVVVKRQPTEEELREIGEFYFPEDSVDVPAHVSAVTGNMATLDYDKSGVMVNELNAPLNVLELASDDIVLELETERKKHETFLNVAKNVDITDLGIYIIAINQSEISEASSLGVQLVNMLYNNGSVNTVSGGTFSNNFYRIATEEEVYEHNSPAEGEVSLGEEHAVIETPVRQVSYPTDAATIRFVEEGDGDGEVLTVNYSNKAELVKKVYKLTGNKIHANCFTFKSTLEARAVKELKRLGFDKVSLSKV